MQMLTIPQLAKASGWPEPRIRKLIKKGRLDHLPDDGLTLLPHDAIEKYIKQNLVKACHDSQKDQASESGRVDRIGSSDTRTRKAASSDMNQLALRIAEKRS